MTQDRVSFVLTLATGIDLQALLDEVVRGASEDMAEAPDPDQVLNEGFPVCWQSELGTGQTLCRIVLDLSVVSEDMTDRRLFAEGFRTRLVSDEDRVESCVRFHDLSVLERNRVLAEEIFEMEMMIREIITLLIALADPTGSIAGVLSESIVTPQEALDNDFLRIPNAENEFFYLLFGQYTQINTAKKRDMPFIIGVIAACDDFDTFKRRAIRYEVLDNEDLRTFISSLKDLMDPIEKTRNAVAHNRVVRNRLYGNYVKARDELMVILNERLINYS
jgi:hypothetical protein